MTLFGKVKTKINHYFKLIREKGFFRVISDKIEEIYLDSFWKWRPSWTLRRIYFPLKKVRIDRPIFFLGIQGGRITLISRCVKRHPKIVTMAGNSYFFASYDELHIFEPKLPEEFSLRAPGWKNLKKTDIPDEVFGYEKSRVYASNRILKRFRKTEEDWNTKIDKQMKKIIKEKIRAYSKDRKNTRFLDMSQSFSIKLKLLNKIFPDAKFILITRNPFAICSRNPLHEYELYHKGWKKKPSPEESLKYNSEHWKNLYGLAIGDLNELNKGLVIKLEDFLENPKGFLKKILDYCELDYSDNQIISDLLPQKNHKMPYGSRDKSKWFKIKKNVNEKYLKKLNKKHKEIIRKTIGPKLLELTGYS